TTTELEGIWRRQSAAQSLVGAAGLARALLESGVTGQLVVTPDARLRAAAVVEASWVRPEGASALSRILRVGPDLGLAVGPRGHAEVSLRRGFVSGPDVISLLPSRDPAGPARWDGSGRFDLRVHETTTVGVSVSAVDRAARP